MVGNVNEPIEELIAALGDGKDLSPIRNLSEGCPACMLAAIRQSKLQHYECDEDGCSSFRVDFDFQKEKEDWFKEWRSNKAIDEFLYI